MDSISQGDVEAHSCQEKAVPMCLAHPLEQLPWNWLLYLDPAALLNIQIAGLRDDQGLLEEAWRSLCAAELGLDKSQLVLAGPVPAVPKSRSSRWRRVFYDLDVAPIRNCLRHSAQDYEFLPSLYGEPAAAPPGVDFMLDEDPLVSHANPVLDPPMMRCRMTEPLGRDRCVMAALPLPGILSATALPMATSKTGSSTTEEIKWHVAYRLGGYYEVSIKDDETGNNKGARQRRITQDPCVSVGLCTPRLSRHAVGRQQAGWNAESWALHADDGHLFHGASHGTQWHTANCPRTSFGPGDVVGCGISQSVRKVQEGATEEASSGGDLDGGQRHIFFTLNGQLLGAPFVVDDVPPDVPLWPCVGLDSHWTVSFNFGQKPFVFDLDAAMPFLEVELYSDFTTFQVWPERPRSFAESTQAAAVHGVSTAEGAPVSTESRESGLHEAAPSTSRPGETTEVLSSDEEARGLSERNGYRHRAVGSDREPNDLDDEDSLSEGILEDHSSSSSSGSQSPRDVRHVSRHVNPFVPPWSRGLSTGRARLTWTPGPRSMTRPERIDLSRRPIGVSGEAGQENDQDEMLDSDRSEQRLEVEPNTAQGRSAAPWISDRMMPFTSKLSRRLFIGEWVTLPARVAAQRYANERRWLDPVDRLVNATLVGAAGRAMLFTPQRRRDLDWLEGRGVGSTRVGGVLWPLHGGALPGLPGPADSDNVSSESDMDEHQDRHSSGPASRPRQRR